MYDFVPVVKMLTVVPVVDICIYIYIYIALYLAVNGPERSSRFCVFYNESIYIMATIAITDPALECKT